MPGASLPAVGDLLEINAMLAESVNEWTQDWKWQGIQEGRKIGRVEGECSLLERQLVKRFGPLGDDLRARLQSASSEQLETWGERVLDTTSLREVFADA